MADEQIPLELWVNIFSFLDFKDLCACEQTNSNFAQVARDERLWKDLCLRSFPPTTKGIDTIIKWKEHYKGILEFSITGKYNLFTCVDSSRQDDFNFYTKSINVHYGTSGSSNLLSRISESHREKLPLYPHPTRSVIGSGKAPWGRFYIIGCQFGFNFSFLHIYEGNDYYTHYQSEYKNGNLQGNWRTNWQELNGISLYDAPTAQLTPELNSKFSALVQELKDSSSNISNLVGEWDIWIFTDNVLEVIHTKNYRIHIFEFSGHSLRGHVAQLHSDSLVLGGFQNGCISLSIISGEGTNQEYTLFSMIGRVNERCNFFSGKAIMADKNSHYCGLFYGIKQVEKSPKKVKR